MKKLITIVAMAIMMVLGVGMSRLNVSAAEVVATTVETVADDVNGDGEVNTKDAEAIIDDLIHNPNTQYCVADWVRISKIVEEKIGPALLGYEINKLDVNAQNTDIVKKLVDSDDLKVKMDENGVTFTRSDENATEVFKFDSCEANPRADIDHIGSFTATDERGELQSFEVGRRGKNYVLMRGLSAPLDCARVGIIATGLNDSLDGYPVCFNVKICGDFSYGGVSYTKEEPLEITVEAVMNHSDWLSEEITYVYGEAPKYEIEAVVIPEGMELVRVFDSDEIFIDKYSITGVVGERMTNWCEFVFDSSKLCAPIACSQLVIHSIGASNTLDGHWTEFTVTFTGDFFYEGVSYDKEHPLVMDVENSIGEEWISGDITYCGEAPKYKIEVINIPEGMRFVGVYKNKEIVIDENAAIITGFIGDTCEFVFDSKNNSSSIQASFDGFEVGKNIKVRLLIVGDFTFEGKTYSEEKHFEKLMTFYIPLCGLDPSYIHWETSDISWEDGTPAPIYSIEVVDIDGTPVEGCVFEGTLAENDGTRVIISNTTNK